MSAVVRRVPAGDLALSGGTFVLLRAEVPSERLQWIRQKLSIRFQFFLGEWFLDLRQGIPYYRDVFVHRPNMDVIRSLFRRIILTTPGVVRLASFSQRFKPSERRLYSAFEVVADTGDVITVEDTDKDFIVDVGEAG